MVLPFMALQSLGWWPQSFKSFELHCRSAGAQNIVLDSPPAVGTPTRPPGGESGPGVAPRAIYYLPLKNTESSKTRWYLDTTIYWIFSNPACPRNSINPRRAALP